MFLGIGITLSLFPGSDQDKADGFWGVGDPTEALACLTLLAALVGMILLLAALCRRAFCPEAEVIAGSYVSVTSEKVEEGAAEVGEDATADPVSNAAAEWDRVKKGRVEGVITEVRKNLGGGRRVEGGGVQGGPGKVTGRGGGRIGRERRRFLRAQSSMMGGGVPEGLGVQSEDVVLELRGVQGVKAVSGVLGDEEKLDGGIKCVSSGHGTGDYVPFEEVSRTKLRRERVIEILSYFRRWPWMGVNFIARSVSEDI